MIPLSTNPQPVRVGYWFHQAQKINWSIPAGELGHLEQPYIHEVRFDNPEKCYEGRLHGFGVEASDGESTICALVEKPDGTFTTASATTIQLIK